MEDGNVVGFLVGCLAIGFKALKLFNLENLGP